MSGDLYRDPRVHVVVDEGRSYIRRSGEMYGSIQATLVDTWAASSSGAFTLSENNIYTVQAFEEFLAHLAPGGILAVTRWYDPGNPKEFLRLVADGLYFVGVDLVGDKILEINVFAPGGIHNINELYDVDVGTAIIRDLERKVELRGVYRDAIPSHVFMRA